MAGASKPIDVETFEFGEDDGGNGLDLHTMYSYCCLAIYRL
jgi:hypothetical protein